MEGKRGEIADRMAVLRRRPLDELMAEAWRVRNRHFKPVLGVSAPSPKVYVTESFRNRRGRFANLSVTGTGCSLRCEHCKGRLLDDMVSVPTPDVMVETGASLKKAGCRGVLVSGGSVEQGYVPLLPFAGAMGALRKMGLKVIAHTGLIDRRTSEALKDAGVMQVLVDVMGDTRTIKEVYHMKRRPGDFRRTMLMMRETGLTLAPHVLLGLYFGKIRGEYRALGYVTEARPQAIVVISITRIPETAMADVAPPRPEEIARFICVARLLNPKTPIILGCMRQSGPEKPVLERLAVDAGVNAIAYPLDRTIEHARRRGLRPVFTEDCCSLMGEELPRKPR
jgi:uncharacterized radical SAM superfamily protein